VGVSVGGSTGGVAVGVAVGASGAVLATGGGVGAAGVGASSAFVTAGAGASAGGVPPGVADGTRTGSALLFGATLSAGRMTVLVGVGGMLVGVKVGGGVLTAICMASVGVAVGESKAELARPWTPFTRL